MAALSMIDQLPSTTESLRLPGVLEEPPELLRLRVTRHRMESQAPVLDLDRGQHAGEKAAAVEADAMRQNLRPERRVAVDDGKGVRALPGIQEGLADPEEIVRPCSSRGRSGATPA